MKLPPVLQSLNAVEINLIGYYRNIPVVKIKKVIFLQ